MFPKSPALGSLRLANISDIPRIAVVATAGFYYSPVFGWERPFHKDFPQDTFHSYEAMFAKIIEDPEYIALVAEDLYDVHESSKTKAIIKPDKSYSLPKAGSPVIVGAATWKLEPGSPRKGQFNRSDNVSPTSTPSYDGGQGRDKSLSHAKLLDDKCEAAENKWDLFFERFLACPNVNKFQIFYWTSTIRYACCASCILETWAWH